jgi:osmotically-inducible protein OsmY
MVMTTELSNDEKVQRDVLDELHWDALVKPTEVGVEVSEGVVTLTGTVDAYPKRREAAEAALRLYGVRGVVNNIKVETLPHAPTDTDIAWKAAEAIEWDTRIPKGRVKIRVASHWITLEGTVDHFYQRRSAEETVERLTGVRGVDNLLAVVPETKPRVSGNELREQIEQAFTRNAEIDARRIRVTLLGSNVTVAGNVRSWAERREAIRAAWSTPGVTSVQDELHVIP